MNILINGANGGIGRALADAAAECYPDAVIIRCARQPEDLSADPSGRTIALDLTDADSIAGAAGEVAQRVDRLHWLINAAGTLHGADHQPEKRLEDFSAAAAHSVMQINAVGPLLLAQQFLPLLRHDEAAIFASIAARVGSIGDNRLGGWYSYRASKAALVMLIKTLSIETARRAKNLTCVALHPGTVDTGLSKPFQANVPAGKLFSPAQSAGHLLNVLNELGPQQHGQHLAWDGQQIPW